MKTNHLIALLVIIFLGCSKPEPAQLTPQEQEAVKKEIREILNLQILACEKADVDALIQAGLDSPDIIAFMTDGTMQDYQGAKNATAELFKSVASAKFTPVKDDFRFLSNNLVLYAWLGKCEMTFKTGEHSKIDSYGITYLFRKSNNQWKVIHSHESASPPIQEKTKE
jgi:ketosteroid isomerase-like protein